MTSTTRHHRPLALLLSAILVAACGANLGSAGPIPTAPATPAASVDTGTPEPTAGVTTSPAVTPAPGGTPSASPAVTPSPTGGPTTIVRAYFFLDDPDGAGVKLVPVLREVPETKAVATAAMNALIAGPTRDEATSDPQLTSAMPAGTTLLGLKVENRVATVDLSREYESGGGSASVLGRLAQVVFTLTQFSNVDAVRFYLDGEPVDVFGSEGVILDVPVGREQYRDQLPSIFVDRPAWGAALNNPGRVAGLANVFEATFRVSILDASGRELYDDMLMADCGSGCWGRFDTMIGYTVSKAQWGTLRVYDPSEVDGSPEDIRDYPVWLTPA